MKILITGSSGFIGQNLLAYLNHLNCGILDRGGLQTVYPALLNNNEVIIHLAGKAHDLKNSANPHEYYDINYELTKKLYNAFLLSNARKFIFISSVKAAADTIDGILTEDVTPNPQTDYGKSKLLAEQYIQSQPLPDGKSCYILRPCMIHGPGNKGNLNLLYKFVKKGIPYPLGGFKNKRSFLSVENLCFVINEIIDRDNIASGVYQVADDEPLSTNEVIVKLSSSLNVKPKLWKVPAGLIRLGAKIGDVLHLPLTTERLNKLTESYVVSNKKLKAALNKELPITAIDGLEITANSFDKNI